MTFEKCRRYGLFLNPKESHFALKEGKLLGHIVSKQEVRIDPKRVEAIKNTPLARSKNEIHSFLGRIIFLGIFILNYAKIVKEITDMLKKDAEVRWTATTREPFPWIKEAFLESPVLVSPDHQKPIQIFSFASPFTLAVVLLQRNQEKKEQPVALFSRVLMDAKLKYNILEK